MALKILSETPEFFVVVKPCCQEYHGEQGVLNQLRSQKGNVHGVHRLDKDTSGLMLFAKDKDSQGILSQMFEERKILKLYTAVVSGKPKKKQGLISGDLLKSRGGSYRLGRTQDKPSKTHFVSFSLAEGIRGLILSPQTGYTHQLRVVCKSLGTPIIGDKRYGGAIAEGMYLHATHLEFEFKKKFYVFQNLNQTLTLFESHCDKFKQELDRYLKNCR